MKHLVVFLGAVLLAASFTTASMAIPNCNSCHNGAVAPSVEQLKAKFTTVDELVAAAKASENAMMKPVQGDDEALKTAVEKLMAAPAE